MRRRMQKYSISEKEKLGDDYGGCDLLSDLPLGIIHIILAFLPIRDAVRTSFLSTQWRNTWTTLPQLVFDETCVGCHICEKYINWVLFRHKGPIYKFKLSFPGEYFTNIDEWIFHLSRNGIRELILDFGDVSRDLIKMRSTIYSCKKLTYLRLRSCVLDPPPLTFKGFLFLRCLSLNTVGLSSHEISRLVDVCPLLENFQLFELDELELKITAPNLKYMILEGSPEIVCVNAPLMIEISVDLTYYDTEVPNQKLKGLAYNYAKCFGGFANLEKLTGSCYFTKYLSLGIERSHHLLVFHHLKLICLDGVNFGDVKEIMVVAHLLIGAPNLQKIKIIEPHSYRDDVDSDSDSEATVFSFKDFGCPSNFKLEKLTDVSLFYVTEVEFLKFLLESSPALETMSVRLAGATEEEWNNLRAELERCNWASPIVKLCNKIRPVTSRPPFSLWD